MAGVKTDGKSIPLSSVTSVNDPVFEKKTGRRMSILGGGNIEDGHVITVQNTSGEAINFKVFTSNSPLMLSSSLFLTCHPAIPSISQVTGTNSRKPEQWGANLKLAVASLK